MTSIGSLRQEPSSFFIEFFKGAAKLYFTHIFSLFCFESNVLNQGTKVCVIMLCNFAMQFVMQYCSHFIKTQLIKAIYKTSFV